MIRLALPNHVPAVELVIRLSVWCVYKVFEGNVDSHSVKHSYLDECLVYVCVRCLKVMWTRTLSNTRTSMSVWCMCV